MPLKTIKEEILELIQKLPDDITLEKIQYYLSVKQKLIKAEAQMKEVHFIPHGKTLTTTNKK